MFFKIPNCWGNFIGCYWITYSFSQKLSQPKYLKFFTCYKHLLSNTSLHLTESYPTNTTISKFSGDNSLPKSVAVLCNVNTPLSKLQCLPPPPPKWVPFTVQGDSYSFDIAESHHDNQIAQSPINVKWKRIELKNYVCNKKSNISFYLQYTVSNNDQCLYIQYPT